MSFLREPVLAGHVVKNPLNILVVQRDDPAESELLSAVMQRRDLLVAWERDLRHARQAMSSTTFDMVLTEERLPDGTGFELIAARADRLSRWATILLTECGDVRSAVAAIKRGAFDVIEKPGRSQRLTEAIAKFNAWRCSGQDAAIGGSQEILVGRVAGWPSGTPRDPIIGQAASIERLRVQVQRIAPVPTDVLIIGETGTGKDLVARQIHALSGRSGALVAVNCGAIPDALFESELFGREEGAYTGATKSRAGKIEQAHMGTLFLDEIESMPLNQQVKLLRVLESRRVGRVGGRGETAVDLRVVAATQEPLDDRCKRGLFRLDLWHRLNVIALSIPPLRERREDVMPLFHHYVGLACARFGVDRASLDDVDMGRLAAYQWPGNVRELKHAAERFVLGMPALPDEPGEQEPARGLASYLGSCERELIRSALAHHGNSHRAAAEQLGISEKTLQRRIALYQISAETPSSGWGDLCQ